jgi:hypothetical protein
MFTAMTSLSPLGGLPSSSSWPTARAARDLSRSEWLSADRRSHAEAGAGASGTWSDWCARYNFWCRSPRSARQHSGRRRIHPRALPTIWCARVPRCIQFRADPVREPSGDRSDETQDYVAILAPIIAGKQVDGRLLPSRHRSRWLTHRCSLCVPPTDLRTIASPSVRPERPSNVRPAIDLSALVPQSGNLFVHHVGRA